MKTYETKALRDGLDPARSGPFAAGWAPGVEFGTPHPITTMDGQKLRPTKGVETKQAGDYGELLDEARGRLAGDGEEDVPPEAALPPDTDATLFMTVPEETVSPAAKRMAEIALLAAEEALPGLPSGLRVRFMQPHDPSMFRLYGEIAGTAPETFSNARGARGTFFGGYLPADLWITVTQHPLDVARATIHEATHAWRQRKGTQGMDRDAQEEEADTITEQLLPLVMAVAEQEGGWR